VASEKLSDSLNPNYTTDIQRPNAQIEISNAAEGQTNPEVSDEELPGSLLFLVTFIVTGALLFFAIGAGWLWNSETTASLVALFSSMFVIACGFILQLGYSLFNIYHELRKKWDDERKEKERVQAARQN